MDHFIINIIYIIVIIIISIIFFYFINDYNKYKKDVNTNIIDSANIINKNFNKVSSNIDLNNNNIKNLKNKTNTLEIDQINNNNNIKNLINKTNTLEINEIKNNEDITKVKTDIDILYSNDIKFTSNLNLLENNIDVFDRNLKQYFDFNNNNEILFDDEFRKTQATNNSILNIKSDVNLSNKLSIRPTNDKSIKICDNIKNCLDINTTDNKFIIKPQNNMNSVYIKNKNNNNMFHLDTKNNDIYLGGDNESNSQLYIKDGKTYIKNLDQSSILPPIYKTVNPIASSMYSALNNINIKDYIKLFSNNFIKPKINEVFTRNKLHAYYNPSDWDGNILRDRTGNGYNSNAKKGNVRKVKTVIANGANASFDVIAGGAGDGIRFPNGVIPSSFTICVLARYSGSKRGRIIDGANYNWLHGWWNGQVGVAHYNGWKTHPWRTGHTDWAVFCGKNSGSAPGNMLYNSNKIGTTTGGAVPNGFGINMGEYNNSSEASDFEVADIIIFDGGLPDNDMMIVSNLLLNKLNDGKDIL